MMEITPLGDSALIVRIQGMPKDEPENAARRAGHNDGDRARTNSRRDRMRARLYDRGRFFDPAEAMRSGANLGAITQWLEEKIRQAVDHPEAAWPKAG
jgi:hypothetical protein